MRREVALTDDLRINRENGFAGGRSVYSDSLGAPAR